jgi:hypothetical protein
MKPLTKAIVVALIQVLIVGSLGAKLLYDRRTRPQAWFKTERYDPNLPIRGRYLSLQVEVSDRRSPEELQQMFNGEIQLYEKQRSQFMTFYSFGRECGSIDVQGGKPVPVFDGSPAWNCDNLTFERWRRNEQTVLRVAEPVLFFISDTAKDPTRLQIGDELWVLATIPRRGLPRPIALGVKKGGQGAMSPLSLD